MSLLERPQSASFETLEPRIVLSTDPGNTLVHFDTSMGDIVIEMFDTVTPLTVQNFLNYVNDGDYDGTFFHRSVPGFVLQGGGFTYDGVNNPEEIATDPPVVNEFNLPNVARTLAMAKLGGDPDSADSQFFFNEVDNAGLDTQNGGFTVFARVVAGWDVVLDILALDIIDFGGAFTDTPVTDAFDINSTDPPPVEAFVYIDQASVIGSVGDLITAIPGTVISADADDTGAVTAALPNTSGTQTVFQYDPGTDRWIVSDLNLDSPGANGTSTETYIDPKDGRTYAAVATPNGMRLFTATDRANGDWSGRNISVETGNTENLAGAVTSFVDPTTSLTYLGVLNTDGELILFSQTGATNGNGDFVWEARNIAQVDLVANGKTMPEFAGSITSYVAPWGGLNVAGLDRMGDLHAVWFAPGLPGGNWQTDNLTDITGAPPLAGRITPWVTDWGAINLVGTTLGGKVIATWWLPEFGVNWRQDDLGALFGGPDLVTNSISSFFKGWGGQNIAGIDRNTGNLVIYWWAPGLTDWQITDMNDFLAGSDQPSFNVTVGSALNGDTHVMSTNSDGDIIRYSWDFSTGDWEFENVTDTAQLA